MPVMELANDTDSEYEFPQYIFYVAFSEYEQRREFMDAIANRNPEYKWIECTSGQAIFEEFGSFEDFRTVVLNISDKLKLEVVRLERMLDPGLGLLSSAKIPQP